MIGDILTSFDLAQIQRESAKNFSQRAYLAPSVFRLANKTTITGWNYYNTWDKVAEQYKFMTGRGGSSQAPAGSVAFTSSATPQTFGNNVDFFFLLPTVGWVSVPYAVVRMQINQSVIIPIRFYKPDGSGPYYAVMNNAHMGIAATAVNNVPAANIAQLDAFHREVQILKSKYNTLAFYLNTLAKKNLNAVEQRSFNEGILLLGRMENDIRSISGITVSFDSSGRVSGIGILPVLAIIAILVTAGATAWAIDRIITERNKTARINSSYDMVKWANDQKLKISQALTAGTISPADAQQMQTELNNASQNAQQVASANSAETPGLLDKFTTLATIGLCIYGISKFVK